MAGRATCPDCGTVVLTASQGSIRILGDDDSGSFVFPCPSCSRTVTMVVESRLLDVLVSCGVPVETSDCPPFDEDDVRAFCELLATDDWFAPLAASVRV